MDKRSVAKKFLEKSRGWKIYLYPDSVRVWDGYEIETWTYRKFYQTAKSLGMGKSLKPWSKSLKDDENRGRRATERKALTTTEPEEIDLPKNSKGFSDPWIFD